jgi:hypothetical protein
MKSDSAAIAIQSLKHYENCLYKTKNKLQIYIHNYLSQVGFFFFSYLLRLFTYLFQIYIKNTDKDEYICVDIIY